MRLLFVNYEWPGVTDCGGSGRMNKRLVDRLESRGHDIRVITDQQDGHYLTFPLRYHRAIGRAIDGFAPDVVFACNTLPSALGLGRLCRRHDVPLAVKPMGSDLHNPARFARIRPLLDRLNARIFAGADCIVTHSHAIAEHVPDSEHTVHIPNGINTSAWTWQQAELHEPVRVACVGRIEPVKQVDLAMSAVYRLRQRGTPATLRIVGDGSERASLERAYGSLDWLTFTGWVEDVESQYHWADVLLLSSAHESFGMVLLEAIATGTPVVSTNTGGQCTALGQTPRPGCLCDPTPSALVRGLESVFDDYREYQQVTRGYCAAFSLEQMARRYERVFAALAEGRAAPEISIPEQRDAEGDDGADGPRDDVVRHAE